MEISGFVRDGTIRLGPALLNISPDGIKAIVPVRTERGEVDVLSACIARDLDQAGRTAYCVIAPKELAHAVDLPSAAPAAADALVMTGNGDFAHAYNGEPL